MEETFQLNQQEQWEYFKQFPFSSRALNFFINAEIDSVDQLTKKTVQEILKYRNVGRLVLMEIQMALARMNLSLEGEIVYSLTDEPRETDSLKTQLKALELKRDEILIQIQQLKSEIIAHKPLKRKPAKNPDQDRQMFNRWKEVRDYALIAQEFSVSSKKVRAVVQNRVAQR